MENTTESSLVVPGYELYGLDDDTNWSTLTDEHEVANVMLLCNPPKFFVRPRGDRDKSNIKMVTTGTFLCYLK